MKKIIIAAVGLLMILSLLSGCLFSNSGNESETSIAGEAGTEEAAADSSGEDTAQAGDAAESASPSVSEDADDAEAEETSAVDYSSVEVITETVHNYSTEYISVSIETPRITGLADSAVQESINAVFEELEEAVLLDADALEIESKEIADEGYFMAAYEEYMGYDVMYLDNGLLSLTITEYMYLGGVHGSTILMAYTFDLETGAELELDDLMKDSAYRDVVNKTIRDEIDRRIYEDELYELATFEDIGDTAQWFLVEEVIVFYFQQYEYFPYAAGIQQFSVTLEALESYLKDDYANALLG